MSCVGLVYTCVGLTRRCTSPAEKALRLPERADNSGHGLSYSHVDLTGSYLRGCVICPGKLAVVNDHFDMHADVILRRYLVPRLFTLHLNFQVKCQG